MKHALIQKTSYKSWKIGTLADGCKQCIKGEKLVMFVTGICPKNCFYCPLSEQKKNTDVIFANERQLSDENDIAGMIAEAKASRSLGAGFTGGDPLSKINRTCSFIKILKQEFGKKFHIHLYTILESITSSKLAQLEDAGLDEIRFHPDFLDKKCWSRVNLFYDEKDTSVRKYSFNIGVEIPVIPGYESQTLELINYFLPRVDFLNLNELEIADTETCRLLEKDFVPKNKMSYGVKGSEEFARTLLEYCAKNYPTKPVHYCTCALKDGVQLKERLRRRAEHIKKVFDITGDDGTLIRGCIYDPQLTPSFGYKRALKISINKKEILERLHAYRDTLIKTYAIPQEYIEVDELKPRIITNVGVVKKLAAQIKKEKFIPAIVEQYPSFDQMEVEVTFL